MQNSEIARRQRVVLIGCGTIAEQFHLPVLAGHPNIELVAVCDANIQRACEIADAYNIQNFFDDQSKIPEQSYDAAILATPPLHHRDGVIALLECGKHVLVEKPIALTHADAEYMVMSAKRADRVLAVGLYKRLLPVVKMIKSIIDSQQHGPLLAATANWGGMEAYHSATLGLMTRETAGGGVLMDLGPHLLDILQYWLGDDASVNSYRDDAYGGIEADCEAKLTFHTNQNGKPSDVPVSLGLSRVRNLENGFTLEFKDCTIHVGGTEKVEAQITFRESEDSYMLRDSSADVGMNTYQAIANQIDDWLQGISKHKDPELAAATCLCHMKWIEDCYALKQPLNQPWFPPVHLDTSNASTKPKVLVTGAGGFVGSKTCETLTRCGNWEVRAHVRSPGSAARIARMPLELVQGDLQSVDDIKKLVKNCDAVVHCAVGTNYGSKKSIYEVTVNGTKELSRMAFDAGVKRFVHLSSIAVHDPDSTTPITPQSPRKITKADWYGYTKAKAEDAIAKVQQQGLETVVLRPGCIYGPYGYTFILNPLRALNDNQLVLEDSCNAPSNTVFVENVAHAIKLALNGDSTRVSGRIIPLVDDEEMTWGNFYDFFANRIARQVRHESAALQHNAASSTKRFSSLQITKAITAQETKEFAKLLLRTDPIGTIPRWTFERFPSVETWTRKKLGMEGATIFRKTEPSVGKEVRFTARRNSVSNQAAQEYLDYHDNVSRDEAMKRTLAWASYAGLIKPNPS